MSESRLRPYYALLEPVSSTGLGHHTYHGVNRPCPAHVIDMTRPEIKAIWEDEIRSLAEDEEWCAFFEVLAKAVEFQRRYAEHGYEFEIVAVYPCDTPAEALEVERLPGYLGLDVSSTEPDSALHPAGIWRAFPPGSGPEHLVPIWNLEQKYFQARLNEFGLLTSYADALLLRDLKNALAKIDPSQGEPVGVRILGLQRSAPNGMGSVSER
jgi:hypothetical protein